MAGRLRVPVRNTDGPTCGGLRMSGKGSGRRPQEAPDEQVADEWARIFGTYSKTHDPVIVSCNPEFVAQVRAAMQADHKDVE